jgi:hypothetical protein
MPVFLSALSIVLDLYMFPVDFAGHGLLLNFFL